MEGRVQGVAELRQELDFEYGSRQSPTSCTLYSWSCPARTEAAAGSMVTAGRHLHEQSEGFSGMALRLRGRTSLSQRQVADHLHVHVRSVQLWEAGESHPSARNLQALIGLFLESGAFTPSLERTEATELWSAADAESDRLRASFDERWFEALLAGRPAASAALNLEQSVHEWRQWGGAPDVAGFLGRAIERSTACRWLQDERSRVVAVVGMGGIGKTLLATRTAVDLAPAFERVCWRSLRDAPPFDEWLDETTRLLAHADSRGNDPTGLDGLLDVAREVRCLLVLDNFESVLEPATTAGRYRRGYEQYGALLEAFAQSPHRSRLLLTSREQPPRLASLKGQSVQVLGVPGLDVADSQALLRHRDLEGDDAAWRDLVQRYGGNPLALKLAGASIGELFGGDIATYVADLELGTGAVLGGVGKLLDSQVQRLAPLELDVLRWLAVEREAVSLADLASGLSAASPRRATREAVEALLRRSLLERLDAPAGSTFALHPVVLEYVSDKLVDELADEIVVDQLTALCARPLIDGVAREYVRASQERVLGEPLLARLAARMGSRSAVDRQLLHLLDVLRSKPRERQAYAPGNIANLLRLHRGNLSQLDLSGLSVRQAFLQDVDAVDLNLADAHLSEAVLAEPFEFTAGVAFSADGQHLAVGTTRGTICLWRLADRTLRALATGHSGACWAVALSADGQRLASGGMDGTVRVWDSATGACQAVGRGHGGGVRSVALSGDGHLLASGGEDGTLRFWDAASLSPLAAAVAHPGGVTSVAASSDARMFASCGVDGVVRLWDGRNTEPLETLAAPGGRLYGVTLTHDGRLVASAGVDGTVHVWNTSSGEYRGALDGHRGVIQAIESNHDGRVVASVGADGVLSLWDVVSMSAVAAWHPHVGGVRGVGVTDSGHLVASVGDDGTIRVWEPATRQVQSILRGRSGWHRDVALSSDGSLVVGAGNDGRVHIWDTDGACISTLRGHDGGVWAAAMDDAARVLATAGDDGTVRLWNLPGGSARAVLGGHQGGVWRVTMSADGRQIASGGLDGTVRIWRDDGAAVAVLHGHTGGVRALAMSADGSLLASGGLDGTIKLWRPPSGHANPTVLPGHTGLIRAVAVNADGSVVASGGADGSVRVWLSAATAPHLTLQGLIGIRGVAVSRDGAFLATGGDDGVVRLWSAVSGTPLAAVAGHVGGAWGVALSADGRQMASGGADGVVRLWDGPALVVRREFRAERPYERMDITGLTGVTTAQRLAMLALGAVDHSSTGA
jgi:WD40 repeat protein